MYIYIHSEDVLNKHYNMYLGLVQLVYYTSYLFCFVYYEYIHIKINRCPCFSMFLLASGVSEIYFCEGDLDH